MNRERPLFHKPKLTTVTMSKPEIQHHEFDDTKVENEHVEYVEEKGLKHTANNQLDDAARILQDAGGHFECSAADKKRVLRLIDLYVCLPMCLTYFLQQVRAFSRA
jgi:hypothetical protein